MKQLIANGRYFVPLTGIEYVAMPCTELQGVAFVLTPPPDTAYPHSTPILVGIDGVLRTSTGTLPITIDELNYAGRVYDWQTSTSTGKTPESS